MKYIEGAGGLPVVELTRRNLRTLLAKLDDPLSTRALLAPDGKVVVRAVPGPGDRGNADARGASACCRGRRTLSRARTGGGLDAVIRRMDVMRPGIALLAARYPSPAQESCLDRRPHPVDC
jgi:hypothetical protein